MGAPTRDDDDDDAEELDDADLEYGEATDFAPGGLVGRYQLCFELASGGMAKVYLARVAGAAGFDKLVALKRIHPHLAEEHEFLEMFMDEARLASRIDHPNVCTVFDFGRAGREHFIAMEYLLGETLGRLARHVDAELAASKRWWALAMRIVAEASEGLQAAHELRNDAGDPLEVVHRDVTPANVFVTYDGAVKVVDFGVARAQERVHQTRAGRVKGQYAYMAPEQAKGKALDRRADVWSLGVLAWELLAGRRLFERSNEAATLMAVVGGEIPALRAVRPEIPEDVEAIVMRALSLEPGRRPATARALARELDRCIARLGEPVGKADLSDLMQRLFAMDIIRRKRMIADARRLEAGRVLKLEDSRVTPLRSAPADFDGEEPTQIAFAPTFDPPTSAELAPAPAAETIEVARGATTRRPVALAAVLGVAGLLALVALGATLALGGGAGAGPGTTAVALPIATTSPALPAGPIAASEQVAAAGGATPPAERALGPADLAGGTAREEDDRAGLADDHHASDEAIGDDATSEDPARDEGASDDHASEETAGADEDALSADDGATGRRPRRRVRDRSRISSTVARAPGTVNVVTPGGWADVYVGSRRVGRSPGRIELPAGRHTLELRPFGTQSPRRVPVDVPSGGTARVSIPVTR